MIGNDNVFVGKSLYCEFKELLNTLDFSAVLDYIASRFGGNDYTGCYRVLVCSEKTIWRYNDSDIYVIDIVQCPDMI
jgi:hypothetical protein